MYLATVVTDPKSVISQVETAELWPARLAGERTDEGAEFEVRESLRTGGSHAPSGTTNGLSDHLNPTSTDLD